jgi:hypothetical protein
MKKSIVCVLVVLTLVSLALTLVPTVFSQTQNVKIVNYTYYLDYSGILDVVGRVQNIGSNTVDPVALTGTIYASDGTSLSRSYCYVWVKYLLPQQYAPFYMEFQPPQNSNGWIISDVANVSLTVVTANATSSYEYQGLKVVSSSASIGTTGDFSGAYVVNGVIENSGSQTATNLTVVATFFNAAGDVVAVGNDFNGNSYSIASLAPSGQIQFQVAAWDRNQSEVHANDKITSYSLLLQAQGPILQGTAPIVTPDSGGIAGATNTPPGAVNSNSSNGSSNSAIIYGLIVVVVIIAVAGSVVVLRRRKPKQPETVVVPKRNRSRRER